MNRPSSAPPNVTLVTSLDARGPWRTKSDGKLHLLLALTFSVVQDTLFAYKAEEVKQIPEDIRGLRIYIVDELLKGSVGGGEFHRIREEMVFVLRGRFKWTFEDAYGARSERITTPQSGVWIRPFILHTYEVLEDKSFLLVVANTLFKPDEPATHDTYSAEEFRRLQQRYAGQWRLTS